MPEFPRYQSKGTLTTQQPSVQAPSDTSGQILEKVGQVGNAVQDIAVKWSNVIDTVQKTTSQANFKTGMLDIQQRAATDPDYNNSNQYYKEIENLKTESLKGFSSKSAENEMALNLNYEAKVGKIQIQNLYRKKMIDVGQASALKLIDTEVNNPSPASLGNIQNILNTQVQAGVFDHKDAYKIYQDKEQEVKFNSFLVDFRSNPVEAEKEFNANAYGMNIETAEKARSKLKELKYIQREQEGNLYSDMSLRVTTGEIKDEEIQLAMQAHRMNPNEGITEAHGKQLMAARYRDIEKRIGAKEFKKYKKAIDFVFATSTQDRVKGYEAILEAYTDGLDADEVKFLKQILDTKKDIVFANKAASGKKLIETLLGARPKDVLFETEALLAYAKRIASGDSPEEAAQKTSVDIIQKDHPAVVADPTLVGAFTPKKGFKNIPKVKNESTS